MTAFIHHIATQKAPVAYQQDFVRDRMKSWTSDPKHRRILHALYNRSGIETRYSVFDDFHHPEGGSLFRIDARGFPSNPTTAERNALYGTASPGMAEAVARKALAGSGISPDQVTHLVYATCTGFANPGPELHVVQALGLRPEVERYTVGFMGCYAAFPALRMASQFCRADENAVVLVICLELCTLHLQIHEAEDVMLANSLFSDGAAAAVVSARAPSPLRPACLLEGFASEMLPQGAPHMAWEIGNHGFDIRLSSYVPEILGSALKPLLGTMLGRHNTTADDVDEWAVHPGGRAILDKVQSAMGLPEDALQASRQVLRNHGNMSSATILFVLKELLETGRDPGGMMLAMAFGPGLTVETALLRRVGARPVVDRGVEVAALQTLHKIAAHG